MPPAPSLLVYLVTLVAGLACLGVAVTLGMVTTIQRRRARSEIAQRVQMLAQHLLLIESRINELESHGQATRDNPAKPPGHTPPRDVKPDRRTPSFYFPETCADQDTRTDPSLIAVPDLGTVADKPDERSDSELGERHGAAWTLAAAGVPPAEIARRTGQPIGQVELIVGLYRKLHSSRGSIDHARSR